MFTNSSVYCISLMITDHVLDRSHTLYIWWQWHHC